MKDSLKVVMIEPRHLGKIDQLHDEQQKALKCNVDRPLLLKEPVLLALGVEKDGELIGGGYFEATAEFCMFGNSAEATAAIAEMEPEIMDFLRGRGIRWVRCFVPKKKRLSGLAKMFAKLGFRDDTKKLSHFAKFLGG